MIEKISNPTINKSRESRRLTAIIGKYKLGDGGFSCGFSNGDQPDAMDKMLVELEENRARYHSYPSEGRKVFALPEAIARGAEIMRRITVNGKYDYRLQTGDDFFSLKTALCAIYIMEAEGLIPSDEYNGIDFFYDGDEKQEVGLVIEPKEHEKERAS